MATSIPKNFKDTTTNVRPHFKLWEFACTCGCGGVKTPSDKMLDALEELRVKAGKPLKIESGYRCQKKNAAVGGSPNSLHLTGIAVDIWIPGMSCEEMYKLALSIPYLKAHRIGQYPYYKQPILHLDDGKPGGSNRWVREKNGQYRYWKE